MTWLELFVRMAVATILLSPVLLFLRRAPGAARQTVALFVLALVVVAPWISGTGASPRFSVQSSAFPGLGRRVAVSNEPVRALAVSAPTSGSPVQNQPSSPWLPWLILFGPSAALLLRFAVGVLVCEAQRRKAEVLDGVAYSDSVRTPLTYWAGRHRILMPLEALRWTAEEREAALAHEAAHISRGDWFWLATGWTLLSLQWWSLLAWAMNAHLRSSLEEQADARAAESMGSRGRYASQILEICQRLGASPAGAVAMSKGRPGSRAIKARIKALLDQRRWSKLKIAIALAIPLVLAIPAFSQILLAAGSAPPASRLPGTTGGPSNNWIAKTEGGRSARLGFVASRLGDVVTAWKPDGTPVDPATLPIKAPKPADLNERMFLFEWEDPTGFGEAGMGSGQGVSGPSYSVYGRGSFTKAPGEPGMRWTAGFAAYPKGFGRDPFSSTPATTVSQGLSFSGDVKEVIWEAVDSKTIAGKTPEIAKKGFHWGPPGTKQSLVFRLPDLPGAATSGKDFFILVRVDRSGKVTTDGPVLLKDKVGHAFRVGLPGAVSDYRSLKFVRCALHSVNFDEIALNPKL